MTNTLVIHLRRNYRQPNEEASCLSAFQTIAWLQQASSDARGRRRPVHFIMSCNTLIDLSIGVLSILNAATNDLALLINTSGFDTKHPGPDAFSIFFSS